MSLREDRGKITTSKITTSKTTSRITVRGNVKIRTQDMLETKRQ